MSWFVIKLLKNLQKSQKVHHKIENIGFDCEIPKKDIYLQKEGSELLISWDYYDNVVIMWYNSGI